MSLRLNLLQKSWHISGSGYYFNYLLELLSTVDFILHDNDDLKEWQIMKSQEVFELVIQHIDNLATGHLLWPVPVFYNACFEAQIFFWWRVMKGEIAPITLWNPDKHRGARKRWRVKGILHIRFQKIENGADKRGTAFYLIIILLNCIVYVACCIAIKSFLNFLHRSTISSIITCSLLAWQ